MINEPGRSAYPFDMSNLLLPLHGALAIVLLVTRLVVLAALIDSLFHPEAAYVASGKQTKWFWVLVLLVGLVVYFVAIFGLIAAIVYFVDVRPAIKGSGPRRGGSSSDGPYGPYRR